MKAVKIFNKVLSFSIGTCLVVLFIIAVISGIENQMVYSKGQVTLNACIIELNEGIRKCQATYIYEYLGTYYKGSSGMYGECEGSFSVGDVIYVNIAMESPQRSRWEIHDVKEYLPSSKVDSIILLFENQQNADLKKI